MKLPWRRLRKLLEVPWDKFNNPSAENRIHPPEAPDLRQIRYEASRRMDWFFQDTPSCTNRYSVMDGIPKVRNIIICSSPWHHDSAVSDLRFIADSPKVIAHLLDRLAVAVPAKQTPVSIDEIRCLIRDILLAHEVRTKCHIDDMIDLSTRLALFVDKLQGAALDRSLS